MKKFLKFLFKGFISNQEVLDEGKKKPFWMALIFLLVSLIISVVPAFVSIANTSGASVLTSANNASLDTSLVSFSKYLKENNIVLKIQDDGTLDTSVVLNKDGTDKNEYVVSTTRKVDNVDVTYNLLYIRVIQEVDDPSTSVNEETEAISKYQTMYASGKDTLDGKASTTPHSYLLFSKTYVYLATYLNSSSVVNTLAEDGSVSTFATTNATFGGETSGAAGRIISDFYTAGDNYITSTTENWKTLFNDLYHSSKIRYLWSYTGLILALNFGVTLLVALLVMILTRLKSSRGDKLNYFDALKVVFFASLAPAIITLALGFMIPMLAQVGFILCLGLRSTFLGMRAANPDRYNQ